MIPLYITSLAKVSPHKLTLAARGYADLARAHRKHPDIPVHFVASGDLYRVLKAFIRHNYGSVREFCRQVPSDREIEHDVGVWIEANKPRTCATRGCNHLAINGNRICKRCTNKNQKFHVGAV